MLGSLIAVLVIAMVAAEEAVMPSFKSLPPPLIYYTDASVKLQCVARPQTAMVRIVYRRRGDTIFNLVARDRPGSVMHNLDNPDILKNTDIHCMAHTPSLGYFLSRPVRLKRTMLSVKDYGNRMTTRKYFYKGNIAQVLCAIPKSQPPAQIEFYKNEDKIGDQTQHSKDKYKMVKLPHINTMALLIKDFSTSDQGMYSCKARNPVTLQSADLPQRVRLELISTAKSFPAKFRLDDPFQKGVEGQKVELREGENATIYCLPEGAPIPTVNWYRHEADKSLPDNAKVDSSFGTLQLVNVKISDHTEFMCSVKQGSNVLTTAISVKVRKRLKIIAAPQNVNVKELGIRAKFTCTVAGGKPGEKLRPEWYHNGVQIDPHQRSEMIVDTDTDSSSTSTTRTVQHSSLTLRAVTTDLMGIYQCVARSESEWDSAAAALLTADQTVISGEEKDKQLAAEKAAKAREEEEKRKASWNKRKKIKRKNRNKKKTFPTHRGRGTMPAPREWPRSRNRNSPGEMAGLRPYPNERPMVPPLNPRLIQGGPMKPSVDTSIIEQPKVQVLFDNMAVELKWKYRGSKDKLDSYRVQYQERSVRMGISERWENAATKTIHDLIHNEYFYVLKGLRPGNAYRFRVNVVFKSGNSVSSEWSQEVDFSHVIDVKPSIVEVRQEGSDSLRITWKYVPPTTSMDGRFPQLTQFIILVRRLIEKDRYEGYVAYKVKSSRRELLLSNLRPSTSYQIVMYGVVESNRRMITRFSNQVSKSTAVLPVGKPGVEPPPRKRHSSAESTKLMFWILGGLAVVMLVVMAFLVGLCLLRQRREKKRTRAAQQAQVNGTALDSYKDPAKMLHRRQQAQAQAHANNQFLLAQLGGNTVPGAPNQNGTWSGPHGHHQNPSYLRGSSASVQQLHQVPGSAMNLNVVPETQSLMMDHYQQQNHQTHDMTTDLGGYPQPVHGNMYHQHGHHNGTLGSKSQLSGITSHHPHHGDQEMVGDMGYPMNTGSVGPYRPLGSGYAPFMNSGQRPSHLDVRPTPCGDAESIYSYFSQQEMGVQHCGLSDVPGGPPMPYRPQLAEAGSQTTDRQQHRHHRRRRRKQASVPPTGPGGPLPTAMEHSVAPSPPMMRDMAVNTELGSTEGTYDQPASSHLPYGYPGVSMAQYMPPDSSGGATASSAASSTPAYHSVTPPARIASLGPHHGYHYPQQQQHQHQQQQQHQHQHQQQLQHQHQQQLQHHPHHQQQQQMDLGPAGPSDASTLTRRGTPTLFVDPPKMRDYSEYAIPETKA